MQDRKEDQSFAQGSNLALPGHLRMPDTAPRTWPWRTCKNHKTLNHSRFATNMKDKAAVSDTCNFQQLSDTDR